VARFLSTPSLFTQSLFVYQFYRYWEGRVLLAQRQCPHRKRGSAFDGGREGEEAEFTGVQLVEAAQVLDDRDAGGEQQGVGGTGGIFHVIDVGAVDADERRAGMHKMLAGCCGEVRARAEVVGGSPAARPVGVDQHGFAAQGESGEDCGLDGAILRGGNDDAGEVGEFLEGEGRQVVERRVTVEGGIDIGAGVAAEFVGGNLKSGAGSVVGLPAGVVVSEEDMEFRDGQAGVGGHAGGEFVAEVDDHEGAMKIQGSEGEMSIRVEAGIQKLYSKGREERIAKDAKKSF
jgi:hypothetical protein